MTQSIRLKNIQAVEEFERDLPPGGFFVLTGTSGVGKSTVINAVDALVRGDGTLEKRDHADEGFVRGFGAHISVKKVQRRSGASRLEVDALAGRFSLADLVDPHIKDKDAADAHRIKALVQLAGAEPDPTLFHGLFGTPAEFEAVVGKPSAPDLVTLAKKVKTAVQEKAREWETEHEQASGAAESCKASADKEAIAACPSQDLPALNAELEDSIRDEAKLKADAESGKAAKQRADEARKRLEDAETAYDGLSIEDANAAVTSAGAVRSAAWDALKEAEQRFKDADSALDRAMDKKLEADRHAKSMEQWRKSVEDAANVTVPSDEELHAAAQDVLHCRQQIERFHLARAAREQLAKAEAQSKRAADAKRNAEKYRKAADGVDNVLSDAVGKLGTPLRVKYGRLVLTTDRGEEHFAELSDGERWALAFDLVIPLIPGNGLLTMPQSAYGELPPAVRVKLDNKLREMGVVCITAQATDDAELSAVTLGAPTLGASNQELAT